MDGTYNTRMGDRGRLVVPAALRQSAGLDPDTPVTLIATPNGVVLVTRDQLKQLVRRDLGDLDLVAELIEDRRRQAKEDAA